jgi:hypothetical protein
MKTTFAALATAAVLALGSTVATTQTAEAHCGWGCGVAIGVGTAALIGAATAPAPAYYGGGAYAYGGYGGCTWRRERFFDGYGWQVRRVRVCY